MQNYLTQSERANNMDYNAVAKKYDNYGNEAITDWAIAYPALLNEIAPFDNKMILDYGCGTGKVCRVIRDKGSKVIGVDISPKILTTTQNYDNSDVEYRCIKPAKIDFMKNDHVDNAISAFVFCNVQTREHLELNVREIYRVLKPGGKFSIVNANWEHCNGREFISYKFDSIPSLTPGQRVKLTLKASKNLIVENYFWGEKDYISVLEKAGFKNISVKRPLGVGNNIDWMGEDTCPLYLVVSAEK